MNMFEEVHSRTKIVRVTYDIERETAYLYSDSYFLATPEADFDATIKEAKNFCDKHGITLDIE